ncbi:MAG TPA: SHOCT domain-containing protein [Solirubrobacteraceae bacterium]|jgi:hypothetical protein
MPLVLLAAKAGALAKTAGAVLAEWNRLPPDSKARVQGEAADVSRSLNDLRKALGARLFGSDDEHISWDQARALALHPRPTFTMAKTIVEMLRQAGELSEEELSRHFAGGHHAGFESALEIALEDGYIQAAGPKRWRLTGFADLELVGSDEVVFLERAIVAHVEAVGLAGRDELALGVGAPEFASPIFLAAAERALASGAIEWLGPGLYGLPRERLALKAAPSQADAPTDVDAGRIRPILVELAREVNELRVAVSRERSGRGGTTRAQLAAAAPAPHSSRAEDPIDRLRRLKELVDAGVLTQAEFEQKKADLLSQV